MQCREPGGTRWQAYVTGLCRIPRRGGLPTLRRSEPPELRRPSSDPGRERSLSRSLISRRGSRGCSFDWLVTPPHFERPRQSDADDAVLIDPPTSRAQGPGDPIDFSCRFFLWTTSVVSNISRGCLYRMFLSKGALRVFRFHLDEGFRWEEHASAR